MRRSRYIYVPEACHAATARCRMHFALHGCGVVGGAAGDGYYEDEVHHLSFTRWGEANRIVIVFPKVLQRFGRRCT